MAGFDNDVIYGTNIDLSNSLAGQGGNATLLTNGQMLIASTALNAGGTHVNVGVITSPLGTLNIGYNSPNITMDLAGGAVAVEHLTGDTGGQLNPDGANNFNLLGQLAGAITVFDTIGSGSTIRFEDRSWQTRLVVDPTATVGLRGTFQTITAAVAAANANDTIFIRPGTYTENFSVSVNNLLFKADTAVTREGNHTVTITGTVTVSTVSINVGFQGIRFNTNSAVCISLTGNASTVTCQNCYFDAINANCISCTGNGSSNFYIKDCTGLIQDTFALLTTTNTVCWIRESQFIDITGTPAASSASNAAIHIYDSRFSIPFSTSSGGSICAFNSQFGTVQTPYLDKTFITTAGTAESFIQDCLVYSGTASGISVGAGTIVNLTNTTLNSSNTNVFTGAGTIRYGDIIYQGSSVGHNVTTETIVLASDFQKIVIQSFTGNGTYTPTTGMKYCTVEAQGGGGGGAGCPLTGAAQVAAGGGGGGGGYARKTFSAATIGASQTVTIGTGGAGGVGNAAGADGVDTTFGALLTAGKGSGGANAGAAVTTTVSGGAGGTGNGDVNRSGTAGGPSFGTYIGTSPAISSGYGGSTALGGGGVSVSGTSTSSNGNTGANYGSGGSGAANTDNQASARNGGVGAPGIVIVTEYL